MGAVGCPWAVAPRVKAVLAAETRDDRIVTYDVPAAEILWVSQDGFHVAGAEFLAIMAERG